MSQDTDANLISSWRNNRSNNANNFTNNATSFFSNLGSNISNSLQDSVEGASNYLPLTSSDLLGSNEEPSWFTLSRFERYMGFGLLIIGSVGCFALSFFLLPVLSLKPRKFIMLWTLGSLLFFISFGVLQGPVSYIKHLSSKERLPFTIVFVTSQLLTIYCAVILKSTILSLITGLVEILSILWYSASYFPFGAQSMQYLFGLGARQVTGMVGI